ncbi:MAG: TonB-dependent receptor [Bacteroidota bacterium]|nr:TonB-dependent receptor [Bacteroidota bacterium]
MFDTKYLDRLCRHFSGNAMVGVIILSGVLLPALSIFARPISGYVYKWDSEGNKQPLQNANLHFLGNNKNRVITDAAGFFSIRHDKPEQTQLIVNSIGFVPDTVLIAQSDTLTRVEFVLKEGISLSEVEVKASKSDATIAKLAVQKTEIINSDGLMKMACCNLAQSFENSATVTVGYADAVSGARQIQLLGLSGIYGQMLAENIPTLRGLSAPYGWNHIPGSWLESVQISKGTSSVVNGYEAITGQINLEFKKPNTVEDFYADAYTSSVHMYETNLTASRQLSKKLWTNLLIHGSLDTHVHDRNKDHFMDMPKSKQFTAFNRWLYVDQAKKLESRTGISFLYEDVDGGRSPQCHRADVYYVTDVANKNFNVYNKTGVFVGKPGQSIAWINSLTYHDLRGYFGAEPTYKLYYGQQLSFYSNLIFSSWIGNKNNQYTMGLNLSYDDYQTYFKDKLAENNVPLTWLNRKELVPGAYFQYTWTPAKNFTLIAGMREDYNNCAGWLFTPRANIRYALGKNFVFRASAGKGYRTPNAIPDNIGLMASTRKFDINGIKSLSIEKAWNYGGNVAVYIPVNENKKITFSLDYFHTIFNSQAIADIERNRNDVYFYNSQGKSFANVWQADLSFSPFERFDVAAAFRYNQTIVTLTDGNQSYRLEKPLSPKYRGFLNLAYATKFRKWVFDCTTQLNGPARLASMTGYSDAAHYSEVYPVIFAQVTKNTKRLDIYAGIENLTNYKQSNPIVNWENPFVKGFDASLVWGPLVGRIIYGGVRLRLGRMY